MAALLSYAAGEACRAVNGIDVYVKPVCLRLSSCLGSPFSVGALPVLSLAATVLRPYWGPTLSLPVLIVAWVAPSLYLYPGFASVHDVKELFSPFKFVEGGGLEPPAHLSIS